jgi:hypothetical protein
MSQDAGGGGSDFFAMLRSIGRDLCTFNRQKHFAPGDDDDVASPYAPSAIAPSPPLASALPKLQPRQQRLAGGGGEGDGTQTRAFSARQFLYLHPLQHRDQSPSLRRYQKRVHLVI